MRIEHGDPDTARRLLRQMAAGLASHWAGEENGIFRVMRQEPDYADYIAPLVAEHRNLRDTVDVTDATDQARIRDAVAGDCPRFGCSYWCQAAMTAGWELSQAR